MLFSSQSLTDHLNQLFAEKEITNYSQTVELIVDSELRGIHTHGLMLLPGIFSAIDTGKIIPENSPIISYNNDSIINIDNNKAFGVNAGNYACDLLNQNLASFVLIQNMNHWGRANYYISKILNKNKLSIGLVLTSPIMKFLSSSKLAIGNNVFSCGIPSQNSEALVVDFCTSILSVGKIQENLLLGRKTDSYIGYDNEGRLTKDPEKVMDQGLVLPFASHKGDIISLLITLFISLFANRFDYLDLFSKQNIGKERASVPSDTALLFSIDIDKYPGFKNISLLLEFLEKKLSNEEEVAFLPGLHSKKISAHNQANGINISDSLIGFLREKKINF